MLYSDTSITTPSTVEGLESLVDRVKAMVVNTRQVLRFTEVYEIYKQLMTKHPTEQLLR